MSTAAGSIRRLSSTSETRHTTGGREVILAAARFAALLALCLTGLLAAEPANAQACPGTGDCCVANGTGGCDDTACCQDVCNLDGFCCFSWDSTCAAVAQTLCAVCSGSTCPGPGDCCVDNGSPACSDTTCCEDVCAQDGSCCSNSWDENCAVLAQSICSGGACSGATCEGTGDCCSENGSPSCEVESCCAVVCDQDAFCCDTIWDSTCATLAETLCSVICMEPEPEPEPVPTLPRSNRDVLAVLLLAIGALVIWHQQHVVRGSAPSGGEGSS